MPDEESKQVEDLTTVIDKGQEEKWLKIFQEMFNRIHNCVF